MKSIMSFVLYGTHQRYWGGIAFNAIAYSLFHPGYVMRLHLHKDTVNVPLFPLIDELSRKANYEIKIIDRPYQNTEATTWRMMPLWDKDVDYLFCRDIDMIPCSDEKQAVELFRQKGWLIHGIRSYALHTTTLMAGMCGFNVIAVRNSIPILDSFDDYVKFGRDNIDYCSDWRWGCDQHLLNGFFYGRGLDWVARHTLDTMLTSATPVPAWSPIHLSRDEYAAVDISYVNPAIREICDNLCGFYGQPFCPEPRHLNEALKIDCDMSKLLKDIFNRHPDVRNYYRPEY